MRRLMGLRRALIGLLVVEGLAALWLAGTLAYRIRVLEDVRNITFENVLRADDRANQALSVVLFAALPLAVVWIVWHALVLANARRRGLAQRWAPWWAVLGWLIPVANLVLPAWQLRDAAPRAKALVLAWAITLDLGMLSIIGSSGRRPNDAEVSVGPNLDRFVQADRSAAVGGLLLAAASVLGVLLVRRIAAEQTGALAEVHA